MEQLWLITYYHNGASSARGALKVSQRDKPAMESLLVEMGFVEEHYGTWVRYAK